MDAERVGIRELRRTLSQYVDRATRGERIVVTEHGRPVAVLSPWLEEGDPLERLVGAGEATRASVDLLDVQPLDLPVSVRGTEALNEERRERLG
jgi:prevent-host-death family protein